MTAGGPVARLLPVRCVSSWPASRRSKLTARPADHLSRFEKEHGMRVLEELTFSWRRAQTEATVAYGDWRRARDGKAYAIYRAAQDRADAAQDALSDEWRTERLQKALAPE
jgi:hypothetical protein